jgi:histone H3/H4
MTFIVKKAIQDFAKKNDLTVGLDAYDSINKELSHLLKEASSRCEANKRKTLKAYDF